MSSDEGPAHMGPMKITREDLDITAIVDAALRSMLAPQGVSFDALSDLQKLELRQKTAPLVWHTVPAALEQVERLQAAAGPEPELVIPDTLEGMFPNA